MYLRASRSHDDSIQQSTSQQSEDTSDVSSKKKRWPDQETRYLIDIWQDNYPISKKRNAAVWESIAKTLNKRLSEEGLEMFRSGTQCKARIKNLEDEYKKTKDHNNRSGNNAQTCEYFDILDNILGCKPNITPKSIVEVGLETDGRDSSDEELVNKSQKTPQKTPDGASNIGNSDDESLLKSADQKASGKKAKQPAQKQKRKRQSTSPDESSQDLLTFLEASQQRDHEFFGQLAEKEAERELKTQKMMFDTIKDIAKIFKDN